MISELFDKLMKRYYAPVATTSRREFSNLSGWPAAEFLCCITNVGLYTVAVYFGDIHTFVAASCSLLSHTIPSALLHDLDFLGIGVVGLKILCNFNALTHNPMVWVVGGLALSSNVIDTLIARKVDADKDDSPRRYSTCSHILWHMLAGAFMMSINIALNPTFEFNFTQYTKCFSIATGINLGMMLITNKVLGENWVNNVGI